jgi:hypothetical protein
MKKTVIAMLFALVLLAAFTNIGSAAIVSAPTTTIKVLNWSTPTTNCDGSTYIDRFGTNVYASSTPTGVYTKIGSVLDPISSFSETLSIPANSTVLRCWMVRAVDKNGIESCNDSNQHCESFFGPDTLAPAGITDLH